MTLHWLRKSKLPPPSQPRNRRFPPPWPLTSRIRIPQYAHCRAVPPLWSVEESNVMNGPTKSKIEAIKPDEQDFDAVGPLPPNASRSALAERYRLAQAGKIIRQLEQIGAVQTDL